MAVDPFFGSLISAGAGLVGGLVNSLNADVQAGRMQDQVNNNIAKQEEFARNAVRWRAQDVMRAYNETGLHPLALLGVQGGSYTPVTMSAPIDDSLGKGIASAGQDISRAMFANADRELRKEALDLSRIQMGQALERGGLENDLLRLRIASEQARISQAGTAPGRPSVAPRDINNPGAEPKIIPDVTVTRTPRGGYVVLPSEAAQQRMEEITGLGPEWFARNRAWLVTEDARQWVKSYLPKPPEYHEWRYNAPTGEWLPSPLDYPDRHFGKSSPAKRPYDYLGGDAMDWRKR